MCAFVIRNKLAIDSIPLIAGLANSKSHCGRSLCLYTSPVHICAGWLTSGTIHDEIINSGLGTVTCMLALKLSMTSEHHHWAVWRLNNALFCMWYTWSSMKESVTWSHHETALAHIPGDTPNTPYCSSNWKPWCISALASLTRELPSLKLPSACPAIFLGGFGALSWAMLSSSEQELRMQMFFMAIFFLEIAFSNIRRMQDHVNHPITTKLVRRITWMMSYSASRKKCTNISQMYSTNVAEICVWQGTQHV